MALAVTTTDQFRSEELSDAYAKIIGFSADLIAGVGVIQIGVFVSKAARDAGAQPIQTITMRLFEENFAGVMKRAASIPIKDAMYEYITTVEPFNARPEEV